MKSNIKEIINSYLKLYPNEEKKLTRLIILVESNKDDNFSLFNRKNFEGHITASGFIYCLSEDKLLLLEHKSLNMFLQPGGHVEKEDETITSAVKREILEETGIKELNAIHISKNKDIPFDINSHYIPANEKKEEKEHYHHDFRYLFIIDKLENIFIDSNESNGYKWVAIDKLLEDQKFGLAINKIKDLIKDRKD